MSITPRGTGWQVYIQVGANDNPTGKPVRVRTQFKDRQEAMRMEIQIRLSLCQHGRWPVEDLRLDKRRGHLGGMATLGDALREAWEWGGGKRPAWKFQAEGLSQYRKALECIDVLGGEGVSVLEASRPSDIESLVDHFRKRNHSNDTVTRKVQAFYRVLWHAHRKGWILARPLWDRPLPGQPRQFLFSNQLEHLVTTHLRDVEGSQLMSDFFVAGMLTGARLNELARSPRSSWDFDARTFTVHPSNCKTGKGRSVILTDKVVDALSWLKTLSPSDLPFGAITERVVSRYMRSTRGLLGYEHEDEFVFHATRHTRATRLARMTGNPFFIMSQLGHDNVKTTMRYIKLAMSLQDDGSGIDTVCGVPLPSVITGGGNRGVTGGLEGMGGVVS